MKKLLALVITAVMLATATGGFAAEAAKASEVKAAPAKKAKVKKSKTKVAKAAPKADAKK